MNISFFDDLLNTTLSPNTAPPYYLRIFFCSDLLTELWLIDVHVCGPFKLQMIQFWGILIYCMREKHFFSLMCSILNFFFANEWKHLKYFIPFENWAPVIYIHDFQNVFIFVQTFDNVSVLFMNRVRIYFWIRQPYFHFHFHCNSNVYDCLLFRKNRLIFHLSRSFGCFNWSLMRKLFKFITQLLKWSAFIAAVVATTSISIKMSQCHCHWQIQSFAFFISDVFISLLKCNGLLQLLKTEAELLKCRTRM